MISKKNLLIILFSIISVTLHATDTTKIESNKAKKKGTIPTGIKVGTIILIGSATTLGGFVLYNKFHQNEEITIEDPSLVNLKSENQDAPIKKKDTLSLKSPQTQEMVISLKKMDNNEGSSKNDTENTDYERSSIGSKNKTRYSNLEQTRINNTRRRKRSSNTLNRKPLNTPRPYDRPVVYSNNNSYIPESHPDFSETYGADQYLQSDFESSYADYRYQPSLLLGENTGRRERPSNTLDSEPVNTSFYDDSPVDYSDNHSHIPGSHQHCDENYREDQSRQLQFDSFYEDDQYQPSSLDDVDMQRVLEDSIRTLNNWVEENRFVCGVCLMDDIENSERISALDCSHRYHESCITRALRGDRRCPTCRDYVRFDWRP